MEEDLRSARYTGTHSDPAVPASRLAVKQRMENQSTDIMHRNTIANHYITLAANYRPVHEHTHLRNNSSGAPCVRRVRNDIPLLLERSERIIAILSSTLFWFATVDTNESKLGGHRRQYGVFGNWDPGQKAADGSSIFVHIQQQ